MVKMNKEILFRAKRVNNGGWIEGYCVASNGKTFIGMDTVEHYCVPALR